MAKTARVRRKDLIQPDQFISTTDIIIAYCSKHKSKMIFLILSLLLVFLLTLLLKYNHEQKTLEMESLYFQLEQIKSSEAANSNEKFKKMRLLLEEFSNGPQKQRALLIVADEFFNDGDYDAAIKFYQRILKDSPLPFNQQLANIGIAYSFEAKEDYKNAINTYKTVIEFPNNYPLFDVYLALARCYELYSQENEAVLILREMKNKFSGNPKIKIINLKLKDLSI
jgi:lipopolysaccharide biosynthesis regulator YciM